MHPIFIDLSHFEPFGLSFDAPMARLIALVVLAGAAMGLSALWDRRVKAAAGKRWYADPLRLAVLAGWAAVAFGVVWVVGRVFSYGLMVALGFILATAFARRKFVRAGLDPAVLNSLVLISLVCGIVGARITFIVYNWQSFTAPLTSEGLYRPMATRLIEMLKINQGGLVFDGGVTLASIAVLIYLWRKRLPILRVLDILAIALLIGLSLGRIGCFMNGCCYGERCSANFALGVTFPYSGEPVIYPHKPDDPPWPDDAGPSLVYSHQFAMEKDFKPPAPLLDRMPEGVYRLKSPRELTDPAAIEAARNARAYPVQPTQLYSMVNAAILALVLNMVWRRRRRDGVVMSLMLIFYGLTRFILEAIRDDNPGMAITPAQVKCIVMVAAGAVAWYIINRRATGSTAAAG